MTKPGDQPTQRSQKAASSDPGRSRRPRDLRHRPEGQPFEWSRGSFYRYVLAALEDLRFYLEGDDELSWDDPFVELHFPVAWDWATNRPCSGHGFDWPDDQPTGRGDDCPTISPGQYLGLNVLQWQTNSAAYLKKEGKLHPFVVSEAARRRIEALPAEQRDAEVRRIFSPLTLTPGPVSSDERAAGEQGHLPFVNVHERKRRERHPFSFELEVADQEISGAVTIRFNPLIVDADAQQAYYPVVVGLLFDPLDDQAPEGQEPAHPEPSQWESEDARRFWATISDSLATEAERSDRLRDAGPPAARTPEPIFPEPTITKPTDILPVPYGDAWADPLVQEGLRHIHNLPLRSADRPSWEELKQREVDRILAECAPEDQGKLLIQRQTADAIVARLKPAAQKALMKRLGRVGPFRWDHHGTEYLAQIVSAIDGRGDRVIGISEQGNAATAWPKYGRKVLDLITGFMKEQRSTRVTIPEFVLRVLVEHESPQNWKAYLEQTQLNRLQQTIVYYGSVDGGGRYGRFQALGGWEYKPGKSGQGEYVIHVDDYFWDGLRAFMTGEEVIEGQHHKLIDVHKPLSREEREHLSYTRINPLQPFFDVAEKLSPEQYNLFQWLTHVLTRKRDGLSSKIGDYQSRKTDLASPGAPDANELRPYGPNFCPLLPPGRRFYGALGHFRNSPESGFSLKVLTEHMGLKPSAGRKAVEQARAAIVTYLGGVVVARAQAEHWLSLEDALALPPEEFAQDTLTWFIFVPEDWEEKRHQVFEAFMGRQHTEGKASRAWKLPRSREEAARAMSLHHEQLAEGDENPLRERLVTVRKELGLKQEQLGDLFEVSKMTISNWESGKKRIPAYLSELVKRWCDSAGKTPPTPEELRSVATIRTAQKGPQ